MKENKIIWFGASSSGLGWGWGIVVLFIVGFLCEKHGHKKGVEAQKEKDEKEIQDCNDRLDHYQKQINEIKKNLGI